MILIPCAVYFSVHVYLFMNLFSVGAHYIYLYFIMKYFCDSLSFSWPCLDRNPHGIHF